MRSAGNIWTAFVLEIILASIIVASTSALFPRCVSCPCGSGTKRYIHCIDESILKDFTCERWSHCQTCKANSTLCATCPPDRIGPTCSETSCPFLERPESGSIRCSQKGNERTCTARCLPGYHFEGEENLNETTLRCRDNVWKPQSFFPPCISGGQCEVEVTGTGSYNCTTGMNGTYCDISCDGQFQGTFHCYPGKAWDPPLPVCMASKVQRQRVVCADPGIPTDGRRINPDGSDALDSRTFQEKESVIFTCNGGFGLNGGSIITCLADGTWSAPRPHCISFRQIQRQRVTCADPGIPIDGRRINPDGSDALIPRDFQEGETLIFSCNRGFGLNGSRNITCLADGTWSAPRPQCISFQNIQNKLKCPFPQVNPSMEVEVSFAQDPPKFLGLDSGNKLTFSCKEGYVLEGPSAIECYRSGRWSTPGPTCKSSFGTPCLNPGHISNGRVNAFIPVDDPSQPSADGEVHEFPVGTRLKFTCQDGFKLQGEENLSCGSDGYWAMSKPMCVKDR